MKLTISKNRTIQDIQHDFSGAYPFLKLEFYKMHQTLPAVRIKKHLLHSTPLGNAGLKKEGHLEINDVMTVGELENTLLENFGLLAQVSRKAGITWLETTMTDNWSLQKQNEYGREISTPVQQPPLPEAYGEDS